MVSKLGEDIPVGIYRSSGDITNFKIRVCIRKTASLPVHEISDTFGAEEYELLQLHTGERVSCSERTFLWQKKVPKEGNTTNPDSTMESSEDTILLFSYVDTELSTLDHKKSMWLTLRHLRTENKGMGTDKTFYSDAIKTFQRPSSFKELVQMSSRRGPSYVTGQSMAIVALLDMSDNLDAEEICLCHLTLNSNGVLTIIPDFSNTPYYIRSNKSETYEFVLEHVSNSITSSEAEQERTFLKRVSLHHAETVSTIVGSKFEMPPNKVKLCYMVGELVSAENFDANNLFIRFTFELPKGTTVKDEDSLRGVTNFCNVKRKINNSGTIAYFASPLGLQLEIDESAEVKKEICLLVEVSSMDLWNICRSEGYGYCLLPISPGYQAVEIKTWKLLPQTMLRRLQNFFIGGAPYLGDTSYTRMPSEFQENRLSKYGLKTEASGSVNLKLHTVVQCR